MEGPMRVSQSLLIALSCVPMVPNAFSSGSGHIKVTAEPVRPAQALAADGPPTGSGGSTEASVGSSS